MEKEEKINLINQLKEQALGWDIDRIKAMQKNEQTDGFFFWLEVIDSMEKFLDKIDMDEEHCPYCGKNLISLYFCSQDWTWATLCGRAGYMKICVDCGKQLQFDCIMMN